MEDGELQGERQQASAISATSVIVALAVIVIAGVIWGVLHLSYRTILGNKDQHIALLERRVAEYRDAVGGATAEEARRRLETMETEIRTLRLRLHPRRISPAQRQAILDRSRLPAGAQPRGVTVVVESNCTDCAAFAEGLVDALRDSQGWSVSAAGPSVPVDRSRTGLAIRVPDRLRPPPDANVLQRSLQSAGLEYTMLGGGVDANVELLVTERLPQ